jgi:hypothetical protein
MLVRPLILESIGLAKTYTVGRRNGVELFWPVFWNIYAVLARTEENI